jgi:hypothetical protein
MPKPFTLDPTVPLCARLVHAHVRTGKTIRHFRCRSGQEVPSSGRANPLPWPLRVTGFDGRFARKLGNTEIHCDDLSDEEDDVENLEDY